MQAKIKTAVEEPMPWEDHGRITPKILKERIRFLEEILQGIDGVIFIHDLKSNHQVWTNGNYAKLLGYGNEEIKRFGLKDAHSLFHPEDMKIILQGIDFLKNDKGNAFSCVYRIRHKAGHWIWMLFQASIMQRDKTGSPRYVVGLAIDFSPQITSERHLEELLAENRRRVNQIRIHDLTTREKEIISHLSSGLTCKDISGLLGISYYTAETHIRNIHHKLGLNNLSALVNFAVECGLKH